MSKKTPAEIADQYLLRVIADHTSSGIAKLPTIRYMAREAGVSYVSMVKGVERLKQQGTLSSRGGSGIYIKTLKEHEAPLPVNIPHWQRVYDLIIDQIERGIFVPGDMLPTKKEMASTFGVCFRTVNHAVTELNKKGIVNQYKKGFRIPEIHSSQVQAKVVLVSSCDKDGVLLEITPRTQEHYRIIEREAARLGLQLEILGYNVQTHEWFHNNKALLSVHSFIKEFSILGIVIWTIGFSRPRSIEILRIFGNSGHPIAVLDENETIRLQDCIGKNIRHFSMACSVRAGMDVADYIFKRGHRKVAYISPAHIPAWSRYRLNGLVERFNDYNLKNAIKTFTIDRPLITSSKSAYMSLMDQMMKPYATDTVRKEQSIFVSAMYALAEQNFIEYHRVSQRELLTPFFEQALQEKDIFIWVCANDFTAFNAIDFLNRNDIAVPEKISVIGFDDTYQSHLRKVSSYNFNAQSILHQMLQYICRSELQRRKQLHTIEVPGFVVERDTVISRV